MPENSVYTERINDAILRLQQSGLLGKLWSELQTDLLREKRSRTGSATALLRAPTAKQLRTDDVEERGLTVADTEGMFLLMAMGYAVALALLFSEMVGGFTNRCRQMSRLRREAADKKRWDAEDEAQRQAEAERVENGLGGSQRVLITLNDEPVAGVGGGGASGATHRRRMTDGNLVTERLSSLTRTGRRRRNNSLATPWICGHVETSTEAMVNGGAGDGELDVGMEYMGPIVERIPTPYATIEERFGERVLHRNSDVALD